MAAFELQISTKTTWFITWMHSQPSQGVSFPAPAGAGAGSPSLTSRDVDINPEGRFPWESLQGDRHTGSVSSAQQKRCFCLCCCSSRISACRERSGPGRALSPFGSARLALGKDAAQSWQRFENVLSLLWALQKLAKRNYNLAFNALQAPSGKAPWGWQRSLWHSPGEHRGNLQSFPTRCERAGIQPLHLWKHTVGWLGSWILLEPKGNIRELERGSVDSVTTQLKIGSSTISVRVGQVFL